MRLAIYTVLLLSLAGAGFEAALLLKPEWLSTPVSASLTELDPATRIGTFRFPDDTELEPLYIHISDATETSTENDRLIVSDGAEESSWPLLSGGMFTIGNEAFHIEAVRPWVGILPDTMGQPLISVSIAVEEDAWAENMILGTDSSIFLNDYQFQLEVLTGKTVAEFIKTLKNQEIRGRWGVQEGDSIHWFDNLLPGSGLELDDGMVYTLLQFREEYQSPDGLVPAIVVQKEDGQTKTRHIVTTRTTDGPLKLEYARGHQLWFVISRDNEIEAVVRNPDQEVERHSVKIGEIWKINQASLGIRVEQYDSAGIAVDRDQTSFQEAVLLSDARRIRVRQGEAVRVGDSLLRYQRVIPPGAAEYRIALNPSMEAARQLNSGDALTLDIADIPYRVRYQDIDMDRTVTLFRIPSFNPVRLTGFLLLGTLALAMLAFRSGNLSSDRSNSL